MSCAVQTPSADAHWRVATLSLTLAIALLSAALVFARAEHIALPLLTRERGAAWLRRQGAVGSALACAVLGRVAAVLYGRLEAAWPGGSMVAFGVAGSVSAVACSVAAFRSRARRRLEGAPELAVLACAWGLGFGWGIPLLAAMGP